MRLPSHTDEHSVDGTQVRECIIVLSVLWCGLLNMSACDVEGSIFPLAAAWKGGVPATIPAATGDAKLVNTSYVY